MTTKTVPGVTLPPTVPGYKARKPKAAAAPKPQAHDFNRWLDAIKQAESVVGYDPNTSPVHGRTDVEVLNDLRRLVEDISVGQEPAEKLDAVSFMMGELIKRRLAKQLAGKSYYGK
jgi:hypothetical protein